MRQLSRDAFCKWCAELFGLDHANIHERLVAVSRLPCGHALGGEQVISAIASIDDQDTHCVDLGCELHGGPESAAAHAPSRCVSTLLPNATGHNTPGVSFRRAQSGCTSRDGCVWSVKRVRFMQAAGGTARGVRAAFGLETATLIHALAAGLDLSALLATSAVAFEMLKVRGCGLSRLARDQGVA